MPASSRICWAAVIAGWKYRSMSVGFRGAGRFAMPLLLVELLAEKVAGGSDEVRSVHRWGSASG
jgi:hypothetical protein